MKDFWTRFGTRSSDVDPRVAAGAHTMEISGSEFVGIDHLTIHRGDIVHLGDVNISINTSRANSNSRKFNRPWATWNLDDNFLRSLFTYGVDHPNMRLEAVLERVLRGLEDGNNLLELIPESSFPAYSLVKALICLLRLGYTVKRSYGIVRDFVEQLVSWINDLVSAFVSNDKNQNYVFTWVTWQGLRKMRDLVDEICSWANQRLVDGRWSRIGHGLMIAKEVDEFSSRVSESSELFKDLTVVNLTGGMSAIKDAITSILLRQDKIRYEIKKIRKQQRKHSLRKVDEMHAQKQAEVRRAFLKATLNRRVVANPTYDEQGKNPCDEGTRVAELAHIKQWLNSITPGSQNFLWLTGDPGCGKSAITASLARDCKDDGVLWAQFFINRNNKETTDPNSYFPSIARQLADFSPDVECAVYDRLKAKPSLMDCISSDQAAKLFVAALTVASKLDPRRVVAVIIDGLDETDRNHLKATAMIFSHLFEELKHYPNVKVFVSSRTEDDIRNPFARAMKAENVKHVHLDTAASIEDVSVFLRRKIAEIVEFNDLNWEVWPTETRMETLAARASGLFIWAVTVAKFLQEQIEEHGTEILGNLLDLLTGDNMKDINTLYGLILRIHMRRPTVWDLKKFRRIIGTIAVLREPLCLEDLSELLDLRETPSSPRVDMVVFTRRFRTVLVAGADAIDGKTIPRLHKSFFEFITNRANFSSVSANIPLDLHLCVDIEVAEGELALCCLGQFQTTYQQDIGFENSLSPSKLCYAIRFWSSHLEYVTGATSGTLIDTPTMQLHDITIPTHLSTLSRAGGISTPLTFSTISDLQSRVLISSPAKERRHWDIAPVREPPKVLHWLQGHNMAVTCLAFSPDGKRLVSGSEDKSIRLWDLQTSSRLRFLDTDPHVMAALTFSLLGTKIAGGSRSGTIHIWDSTTLHPLGTIDAQTQPINSVVFSPDGTRIVTASSTVLCLWNAGSYEPIGRQSIEDPGVLTSSLIFVPDGRQVVSGSRDGTVRIWDGFSCMPILTLLASTSNLASSFNLIYTVAVSPDGNCIVAGGTEGLFSWIRRGEQFEGPHKPLTVPQNVLDVIFSPDGTFIFVHSVSPSLGCYNVKTGEFTPLIDRDSLVKPWDSGGAFSPTCLQFAHFHGKSVHVDDIPRQVVVELSSMITSHDGNMFLYSFADYKVYISDSTIVPPSFLLLEGHDGELEYAAFSHDQAYVAGATDREIYLWDTSTQQLIPSSDSAISAPVISLFLSTTVKGSKTVVTIVATHATGPPSIWEKVDEKLVMQNGQPTSPVKALSTPTSDFLHVDEEHPRTLGGHARWFPGKKEGSNFWAYINGYIVIGRMNGSITILPVQINNIGV